jgi:4-hydroxy-tetrahydrodipicolinate synthase
MRSTTTTTWSGHVPPFSITDALRGVCAVTVTPFDSAGEFDRRSTARLARHIARGGVNAITVGGSVGEYMSLTAAEALAVLTETIAAVDGALPVLGATGFDLRSAIERAQAAVAAGAAGIMIHQPHHPFRSPEGWSAYHQKIADELDPSPIVLYINDAGIGPSEIGWLAERCPNIAAVKYAVPDPPRMASLASGVDDRLVWLCGLAERWAPAFWAAGARGFTSGLANVNPALAVEMLSALQRGDPERCERVWTLIEPFETLRAARGGASSVGVVKAALAARRLIAETTVRPPLSPLPGPQVEETAAVTAEWPDPVERKR